MNYDNRKTGALYCLRCPETEMTFSGFKKFHEGQNWGFLGDIGEFFVKRERFEMYTCPNCGKVELFAHGVGEELDARYDHYQQNKVKKKGFW